MLVFAGSWDRADEIVLLPARQNGAWGLIVDFIGKTIRSSNLNRKRTCPPLQSQKAVIAYLKSKQFLPSRLQNTGIDQEGMILRSSLASAAFRLASPTAWRSRHVIDWLQICKSKFPFVYCYERLDPAAPGGTHNSLPEKCWIAAAVGWKIAYWIRVYVYIIDTNPFMVMQCCMTRKYTWEG